MPSIDKNRPPEQWIDSLRKRFPCEREVARVLTRKLQRRAGPPLSPPSLETLTAGTHASLKNELKHDFEIIETSWLSGRASKLQMAFRLKWNQPSLGRWRKGGLTSFDVPALRTQAVEWQLNHREWVWEEDTNEDVPLMRLKTPKLKHISSMVLAHAKQQLLRERAWLIAQGWAPDPKSIPAVDTLI
jgi:hypothetical protein